MPKVDVLQRLRAKYKEELRVPRLGNCWIWTASLDGKGYGQISYDGRQRRAHRIAYILLVGQPPPGTELDHLCRVKTCVNPAHLEPVTHKVNALRGESPPAKNAAKTHCPQEHPYDLANTMVKPNGWRYCRACNRARAAKNWRAKRAAKA